MTPEPSFHTPILPSDPTNAPAAPAESRSWAPPAWPSDNFASSAPLRKRAIGWRGQLRSRG
jgi:hypothetical protein